VTVIPIQGGCSLGPLRNKDGKKKIRCIFAFLIIVFNHRLACPVKNLKYLCTSMTPSVVSGSLRLQRLGISTERLSTKVELSVFFGGGMSRAVWGGRSHCFQLKSAVHMLHQNEVQSSWHQI